jgi:hypothetical protein
MSALPVVVAMQWYGSSALPEIVGSEGWEESTEAFGFC